MREWFSRAFPAPTPAQERGWPAIAAGQSSLILAPTGSGKTLAAFLWALNGLVADRLEGRPASRVLYLSPLKALNYDVERNLRGPLAGIAAAAERSRPARRPRSRSPSAPGTRPSATASGCCGRRPDVLITTPESLYLLLTSRGREMLAGVRSVIVDEIHAVAGTKRGAHLALSLERLERLVAEDGGALQRIGLSATQRPLSEIARFLGGQDGEGRPRPVTIVDAGAAKELDLAVIVPVEDMRELGTGPVPAEDVAELVGGEARTRSIWPAMYPELLELVRAHRSTLIFVNNRRLAERLALRLNELAEEEVARAHHGSLAREQRTLIEEELKAGRAAGARGHQQPRARHRHGRDRPRHPGREPAQRRPGDAAHRPRRAPGGRPEPGRIFPKYRGDLLECAAVVVAHARAARSRRRACRACRWTCWRSRSWR